MSPHGTLILYIALIIITVGGIAVLYDVTRDIKDNTVTLQQQEERERQDDLRLVSSIGYNIYNDSYQYMRFQIEYSGEESMNLNDTFIQVRTEDSTADLRYRNGTPTRSVNSGFYTE